MWMEVIAGLLVFARVALKAEEILEAPRSTAGEILRRLPDLRSTVRERRLSDELA